MLSVQNVINVAKVSVSLVIKAIDLNQENDIYLPKKISVESSILEWVYNNNYNGINLQGFAEYVYAMCGGYAFQAEALLGIGGVVVNPSTGTIRIPIQLGAFAVAGSTTIVFTDAINKTLLYASRGGIDVGEIVTTGTPTNNQVKWDSATGTLTVASIVPFTAGEYVRIIVY